jgi:hypothetical protein
MSQFTGDLGSKMMFARSQYEQNAKRKNVIIPKGTIFKNVKISSYYDNSNGAYYLSTLTVQDQKRGDYDEGQRAFKESDFKVTNLLKEGNNFFNLKNFLVVKNNGFNISENAIVDIELNKDITVSIFDEPYIDPIFNNSGFPANSNATSTPVLCKDGTTKIQQSSSTDKYADACMNNGGRAENQPVLPLSVTDPELFKKNMELSAKNDEKMKQIKYGVIAVVLVAGYFAYKKFKK